MRKLALPLILALSLGASGVAMAATDTTTNGAIKALDTKACTVTLDNKSVYHFAAKCDFTKLKVGEKVAITWHLSKKLDVATKIVAVTA